MAPQKTEDEEAEVSLSKCDVPILLSSSGMAE